MVTYCSSSSRANHHRRWLMIDCVNQRLISAHAVARRLSMLRAACLLMQASALQPLQSKSPCCRLDRVSSV